MKRYEGLFILETTGQDEALKALIDKITADIEAAGGKVETTQKMEKRTFARVANKKTSSGFYLNVIFQSTPSVVAALRARFATNEEIFRVLFTVAPPVPLAAPAK